MGRLALRTELFVVPDPKSTNSPIPPSKRS
jgi:hypothetical protein